MTIPFVKSFDFQYGRPDQLSPLVSRVICRNPGPFTFTGSGTYIIGRDQLAIIDPGPDDEEHLGALLSAVDGRPVTHILITHTHRDHCGGAHALSQATGASIYAWGKHPSSPDEAPPALDEGGDFSFRPDRIIADGEMIMGEDWCLQALYTPGHISNHLCFALPAESALFTGDHIMGWATTVIAPPDGDMGDYMASLEKLLSSDDSVYYPTHGAPIDNPRPFVEAIKAHRLARDAQILASIQKGNSAIMEIVQDVYRDVDKSLHLAAALNVKSHLDRHVAAGHVESKGTAFPDLTYRIC